MSDSTAEGARRQLAEHLDILRTEGVWGLPVGQPEAVSRPPTDPDGDRDAAQARERVVEATESSGSIDQGAAPGDGRGEAPSEAQGDDGEARSDAQGDAQTALFAAGPSTAFGADDEDLRTVEAEALQCVACRLHETRTKVVFGVGSPTARLMFIGEGPGRDEDLQGEPFVGRAGQLLTKIIVAMGYRREDVYIGNAVKCRPPQNRDPRADEVAACHHFLMRQIAVIKPEILVLLGRSAVQAVLELSTPMSRLRGRFREWNGVRVMCTYHPAYLLRNPSAKGIVWEDMKKVREALDA